MGEMLTDAQKRQGILEMGLLGYAVFHRREQAEAFRSLSPNPDDFEVRRSGLDWLVEFRRSPTEKGADDERP